MGNQIPTTGLLIRSSYEYYNKRGHYAIMDLATNKLVAPVKYFNGMQASDNSLCLLAIHSAVSYCLDNGMRVKVYAANSISIGWARKGCFKSRDSVPEIRRLAHANLSIAVENDFRDLIEMWQPKWGSPKDWLHHLVY